MNVLKEAKEFAKKEYQKNDSFHQYSHVQNVMKRALQIAGSFKDVDYEALKLAIIFHDIDYSSYENHPDASVVVAETFLKDHGYPTYRIEKIKEIMINHSTPHRIKLGEARLLEGKIIYDADKSIFITNKETYDKYFHRLYLEETKRLVSNKF